MSELPEGWVEATIEEVADYVSRGRSPRYVPRSDLPVINQRCIRWEGIDEQHVKFVRPSAWDLWSDERSDERYVRIKDILWNSTGTGTIGRATLFAGLANYESAVVDSHVTIVRANRNIDATYLFYFIKSPNVQDKIEDMQSGSTNQVELNRSEITATVIPIAPLPEQKRIVAKIDSLTARTARARTDLARVPALVAKYRSALLELAFSGILTADFRGESKDATRGLPHSWNVRLLGEISEIQGGIQVGKKRNSQAALVEVPYLRVANVQRGWLNLEEVKTIAVTPDEKARLLLRRGDVLMNEGGDRDKLGRGWIWDGQIAECIHQNHVFRIRLDADILPPEFVSHFANERGQRYFFDEGTQTTNLASISKRKVAALPVPVPPSDEAVEIVRRIQTAFAWLDRVCADHTTASKLLPKLDAAILAKAFRGELVPQDPNEEPAEAHLARVREARAAEGERPRQRVTKDKAMSRTPKELLLLDSQSWPANGLPFREIGKRVALPRDEMRDALFALLGGETPILRQFFDKDAGCMHLRRVSQ